MINFVSQAQNLVSSMGLPKVHKPGTLFRSILSSIGTCGYNLSKFLVPHLEHLTINEFTVKDSFSFADEISKHQNSDNFVMAIVSM